ncbi:MAG: 30S ribosomal protein S6e [Haloquadratum sp.]|nr:30S ribosomal protein S6e [Haloquadratum sp.]
MTDITMVVSDATGSSQQVVVEGAESTDLMGAAIGETVDGAVCGLDGITVELTGGSDAAGRPMRPDVPGSALTELLSSGGIGYRPTRDGERKRVTVRGRQVSAETAQVNAQIADGATLADADEDAEDDAADDADVEEDAVAADETEADVVAEDAVEDTAADDDVDDEAAADEAEADDETDADA